MITEKKKTTGPAKHRYIRGIIDGVCQRRARVIFVADHKCMFLDLFIGVVSIAAVVVGIVAGIAEQIGSERIPIRSD